MVKYIWKDLTGTFRYFWSPNRKLLELDFSEKEKRVFTITREILWHTKDIADKEINEKEVKFILKYNSNDPKIWYSRWPKISNLFKTRGFRGWESSEFL